MILQLILIEMAEINFNDKIYYVSDEIQAKYPELVKLVINTESMEPEEKQYWFDIMPSMNDEQIDRLYSILETERRRLEELEEKYQEEIKALNEKHMIEWQEYQANERKKIKNEEQKDSEEDAKEVLQMLDDL
jgi:hypothetical protein